MIQTNGGNGRLAIRVRKRVGLIVPSTNTVMEPDLYRNLPPEVTLHTSRMMLTGGVTIEAEEKMLDEYLPQAALEVATFRPDVVVFGCTSAGALRGPRYEKGLRQDLARTTGAHAITIMGAVESRLRSLGAKRIAVLTPYSPEINETIRCALQALGFQVIYIEGLDVPEAFRVADITPEELLTYVLGKVRGVQADCLFLACANLRALEAIDTIRAATGLPVVTSNQAVLEELRIILGRPAATLAPALEKKG